jgi:hypothetical protein
MLVLFTVLGGPIGGLSLAIAAQIMEPSQIDEFGPVYIWGFPFYGFFIGLIPAFVGGGIYSVLPLNVQRVAIAPVVGFITSLGFALAVEAIIFASTGNRIPFVVPLTYAGAGAVAALFCALLVRAFKIDKFSAGGG